MSVGNYQNQIWLSYPLPYTRVLLHYIVNEIHMLILPTSIGVVDEGEEVFGGARVTGSVAAEATKLVVAKKSRLTVTYWPTPSMPG